MIDLLPELKKLQDVGLVLPSEQEMQQKCSSSIYLARRFLGSF